MPKFEDELVTRLSGLLSDDDILVVRKQLEIVMKDYDIERKETALVPFSDVVPPCFKAFMVTKKLEGKSMNTLNLYSLYILDMFRKVAKPIDKITANDIRAYLYITQEERTLSNRTLDSRRSALSSFFNWCAGEGYIPASPMAGINPIKYEREERKPLTDYEMESIRQSCGNIRERAIIEVLYSTACRVSELTGLNRKDVDLDKGEVILFGKGGKHRKSYLNARAVFHLREYLDSRTDDNDALIVSAKKPYDRVGRQGIERMIRDIGKRAGVERLHPHLFRHTTATNCLQRGMDVTQLRTLLGHSSVETTMIYAKVDSNAVKENHRRYLV